MKTLSRILAALLLVLTVATAAQAAQGQIEVDADITVIGTVAVMDDGVFLDDGTRLFLLIDMEDTRYEGLTVEVIGQYMVVDDMPAIRVQEMTVLEDSPSEGEQQESPANTAG
jgi:hypothetical protein